MSEKKAFMLYLDYKQHLELLTDAERGMLMMALFDYAADKTEPTTLTGSAAMAFSFIRAQMDRDNQKYEEKCITNRANGAKGGRPRKEPTESDVNPKEPKKTERFSEKPKKPDTDTETDTDTNTDTDTDNKTIPLKGRSRQALKRDASTSSGLYIPKRSARQQLRKRGNVQRWTQNSMNTSSQR